MPDTTKHLGLRLAEDVARVLDRLMADEARRVGPCASVSASGFVTGLILAEAQRREVGLMPEMSKAELDLVIAAAIADYRNRDRSMVPDVKQTEVLAEKITLRTKEDDVVAMYVIGVDGSVMPDWLPHVRDPRLLPPGFDPRTTALARPRPPENREIPMMHVRLGRDGQLTGVCPYCRKKHTHGTGGSKGPDFGYRVSHCNDGKPNNGYVLVLMT